MKHESGITRSWGNLVSTYKTLWEILGGPIIGFSFDGPLGVQRELSFLVGDFCRPKYFGARKVSLNLGVIR